MKFVGYKRSDFKTDKGLEVQGYIVYFEDKCNTPDSKGVETSHCYLSLAKIKKMQLDLDELIGQKVIISYNRFGKPETIFTIQ